MAEARLTVQRVVVSKSVCDLCEYTRPYSEGDETRPCPACNGGRGKFWATSELFPNDVGPSYLRRKPNGSAPGAPNVGGTPGAAFGD